MLIVKRATILQFFKIKEIADNLKADSSNFNFYSNFKGSFIKKILEGRVYFIIRNTATIGVIVMEYATNEICYLPYLNSISIFKLLYILNKNFDVSSYKISLNYKKLNIDSLKKYFPIKISENMMFMYRKNDYIVNEVINNSTIIFRSLEIDKEEYIRVELQNRIFDNIRNRSLLTIDEVLLEEMSPRFLKDFCFIIEVNKVAAGYGQIMKINNAFFLVNFGIVPELRNSGYGYYFLNNIIQECEKLGMNNLCLSVDKNNQSAINLYEKGGFKEMYNTVTIDFSASMNGEHRG